MENHEAHQAAMERINSGAEVPPVDPSMVESLWDAISSIPAERRGTTAVDLGAVAGANLSSLDPEQHVALMTRCMLLSALAERGVLNDYIGDEFLRKKLLVATATLPFSKNDLAEALAGRIFRESPPDVVQKTRADMIEAGLDPDFPNIAKRLIACVRDNE